MNVFRKKRYPMSKNTSKHLANVTAEKDAVAIDRKELAEVHGAHVEQIFTLKSERDQLLTKLADLEAEAKATNDHAWHKYAALAADCDQLRTSLAEAKRTIDDAEYDRASARVEIADLRMQVEKAEAREKDAAGERDALLAMIAEWKAGTLLVSTFRLGNALGDGRTMLTTPEAKVERAKALVATEREVEGLRASLASAVAARDTLQRTCEEQMKRMHGLEAMARAGRDDLAAVLTENITLIDKLAEVEGKAKTL